MAAFTVTIPAGQGAGAAIRALGKAIELSADNVPDNPQSGTATVLTIDVSPSEGGVASVITSGAGLPTQKKHRI